MAKKNFTKTSEDLTGAMASSATPTPSVLEQELTKEIQKVKTAIFDTPTEQGKKPKKETEKGTISVNAMIEKDLYTSGKIKAFEDKKTFSTIINEALREYLNK